MKSIHTLIMTIICSVLSMQNIQGSSLVVTIPSDSMMQSNLGTQDVRPDIQAIFYYALADIGFTQVEKVFIKKMNSCLASHYLTYSYKNTIWVNEAAFDELSDAEQLFAAYHEAAHYVLGHTTKIEIIALSTVILTLGVGNILWNLQSIQKEFPNAYARFAVIAIAVAGGAYAGFRYWFIPKIHAYEKAADIFAARQLCKSGKDYIVSEYINSLKERIAEQKPLFANRWHPSLEDQLEYLTTTYTSYTI